MQNASSDFNPSALSFQENKTQTTDYAAPSQNLETQYEIFLGRWNVQKEKQRNGNVAQMLDTYMHGLRNYLCEDVDAGAADSEEKYMNKQALGKLHPVERKMYRVAFSCFLVSKDDETEKFKDYVGAAMETTNDYLGVLMPLAQKSGHRLRSGLR